MNNIIKRIEHTLVFGILIFISVILILAFIDIAYVITQEIFSTPKFIIDANGLLDLFSLFLVLLIGRELLETVKAYFKEDIVHVEYIILVAIIALARKVIVWDFNKYNNEELLGLAAMIVALGITYFLIKKADVKIRLHKNKPTDNTK